MMLDWTVFVLLLSIWIWPEDFGTHWGRIARAFDKARKGETGD